MAACYTLDMDGYIPRALLWPTAISLVLINIIGISRGSFIFLYYLVFVGLGGFLFIQNSEKIKELLQRSAIPRLALFAIVGYLMVLFEESIVGAVHAITEGLTLSSLIERVGEFWLFNIFAFTGFIFAWYVASRRFPYTRGEIFLLSGVWGLYAEHIFTQFASSPAMAILLILPTMCSYALISAPMLLIFEGRHRSKGGRLRRYAFVVILMLALSLPPIALLKDLRNRFPHAFPPCQYIACDKT